MRVQRGRDKFGFRSPASRVLRGEATAEGVNPGLVD
jgi:hypothetical protein